MNPTLKWGKLPSAHYNLLFEEVVHPDTAEFPHRHPTAQRRHRAGHQGPAHHEPGFCNGGKVRKRADRVTQAHRFPDGTSWHISPDEE
ncbi:hypothetical protein PENVUL_c041G02295 [Penicillium vulpinum]|uniref:Uncharacterized protein n=1 Tax=Penicillium vulpinum TaxID=29845 RepID=A0A1V6RJR9_9EURO|nr:hypothetical protein PENVUL_c041G02295 [Penicillium vulpinum]